MRLTEVEKQSICEVFLKHYGKNDHIWLFGSRVDDMKKGGDIDFYIETEETNTKIALEKKLSFLSDLWTVLGEQKIDVVLNLINDNFTLPIYQQAKTQGILLI